MDGKLARSLGRRHVSRRYDQLHKQDHVQRIQERLHVTERFTRVSKDLLRYQVTIDDPTTYTKPWTIEVPATPAAGRIYEYACHEGNYAMEHALSGSRAAEKAAEAAKKQSPK